MAAMVFLMPAAVKMVGLAGFVQVLECPKMTGMSNNGFLGLASSIGS